MVFMLLVLGALAGIVAIGWCVVTQWMRSGGGSSKRRDDLDRVDRGE